MTPPPTPPLSSISSIPYPAADATFEAVNWDAILSTVCDKLGASSAQWGHQKSGSYSLVRFLHLDDDEVAVRVPLYPDPESSGPMTPEIMCRNVRKTASMVASMEYVAAHTDIPVPRIIYSCLDPTLDGVQSPYVVMSKAEGKPLCYFWDNMADAQRDIVLKQVIDILLTLSTLRFDKIGSLFRTHEGGWHIEPSPEEEGGSERIYTSGADEFITLANVRLQKIRHGRFGNICNVIDYPRYWFMRSLIPCLYDDSLDVNGFPLMHGDFHSQNIFIVDPDTNPRITAVIDWDDTVTTSTSSFAQYPFFIVDHPMWEKDHILRPRNVRDQASFNRLLEKAEREKFPNAALSLSRAYAGCKGLYLFEQCIRFEYMYHELIWELVCHIFGPDAQENGWDEYANALEQGILKDDVETLGKEADVFEEATEVLKDEVELKGLSKEAFIKEIIKHKERFSIEGKVVPWLREVLEE